MLIHPIAENTLKFPSKFKLEIEEFKAQEFTLNPVEKRLGFGTKNGFGLAPSRTGCWLSLHQGFTKFSPCFQHHKTEQPTPKISSILAPPFSLSFRPLYPKLGFKISIQLFGFLLGDLMKLVARIEV